MRRRHRRLPRILLNAATVVSVVLCVATIVLWVRSYLHTTVAYAQLGHYSLAFNAAHGVMALGGDVGPAQPVSFRWHDEPGTVRSVRRRDLTSFHAQTYHTFAQDGSVGRGASVELPFWATAVVVLIPVVFRLGGLVRRWRRPSGLCPLCGYDLRATPERCPECGRAAGPGA